jgi:hypothetical protein
VLMPTCLRHSWGQCIDFVPGWCEAKRIMLFHSAFALATGYVPILGTD